MKTRWQAATRSIGTTRLIVYPAVVVLALATVAARAGWFAAGSSAQADPMTVLRGETAQQQPISVTVDRRGNIMALDTRFLEVCRYGQGYPVTWSPNSPRIPFVRTPAGIFAEEVSTQKLSGGVASRITATTIAHLHGRAASGDAEYYGTFRYPTGREQWCSSGPVHWTVYAPGAVPAAAAGEDFSLGAWGGYIWQGRVRSLAASWRVPSIFPNSGPGTGATWIGAEASGTVGSPFSDEPAPFGAYQRLRLALRVPFIQVGLNEVRTATASGATYDSYFAFWTDSVHSYSPIRLFGVAPGDRIVTGLRLEGGKWKVSIRDLTSGNARLFTTRDEALASFRDAEWLQENPSATPFGTDEYLYPRLATVRFQNLEVNSAPPAASQLIRTWMSAAGGYLAPSSPAEDAFSMRPATLSPAGARYLTIASAENSLISPLVRNSLAATAGWPTSPALRERTAQGLQRALNSLRSDSWPAAAQPLVAQEIDNLAHLIAATRGPRGSLTSRGSLGSDWIAAVQANSRTSQAIRRVLGLPRESYAAG